MKFLARVVATVILGSLLFIQAFAEDSANSSNSTIYRGHCPKRYWQLHRLFGAIHPNTSHNAS